MRMPGWIERVGVTVSLGQLSGLVHPATAQTEDVLLGSRHGDDFDHFSRRRTDLLQRRPTAALLTSVAKYLLVEDILALIDHVLANGHIRRELRTRRPFDAIQ